MTHIEREEQTGIEWIEVVKKEARGIEGADLGEIQEIGDTFVKTKKGLLNKEEFYLPKYLVESYDGHVVQFNISKDELDRFTLEDATSDYREQYNKPVIGHNAEGEDVEVPRTREDIEQRIPLMSEKLNVSKTEHTSDATITKEPVTETKRVEVPVTHEEITIERRPASAETAAANVEGGPVTRETDVVIPLKHEEVTMTKTPYVAEEVVVRKKPVTETKVVEGEVRSERVKAEGTNVRKEEKKTD